MKNVNKDVLKLVITQIVVGSPTPSVILYIFEALFGFIAHDGSVYAVEAIWSRLFKDDLKARHHLDSPASPIRVHRMP
jgi:hypothetical protein